MKTPSISSFLAACAGLTVLYACGGSESQGSGGHGGGGTTSATTSSSISTSSTTSTSSTSTTSTSSSSTSSSSSSSGAGGAGCTHANDQVHLQGTVDGQDVVHDYAEGASQTQSSNVKLGFGAGGLLYLSKGKAPLLMPEDGELPGALLFSNAASLSGHTFTLASLANLGTCPAASGDGDLSFCFDTNHTCPGAELTTTTGSVDGSWFDWGGSSNYQNSGASPGDTFVEWQSGAVLFANHTGDQHGGTITSGFLWMPSSGPDPGAFWCIGGGYFSDDLGGVQLDVYGLTRLGTPAEAPAASGTVEGCY